MPYASHHFLAIGYVTCTILSTKVFEDRFLEFTGSISWLANVFEDNVRTRVITRSAVIPVSYPG